MCINEVARNASVRYGSPSLSKAAEVVKISILPHHRFLHKDQGHIMVILKSMSI